MGRFMRVVCAYSWCWTRCLTCFGSKLVVEWWQCTGLRDDCGDLAQEREAAAVGLQHQDLAFVGKRAR